LPHIGPRPDFLLAGGHAGSRLWRVENGFVNLLAIVGFLIVAIGLIPAVLILGSPKAKAERK
jgi:hypothetical protein